VRQALDTTVATTARLDRVRAMTSLVHDPPWLIASVVFAIGGAAIST
jgi:hypothetical protein